MFLVVINIFFENFYLLIKIIFVIFGVSFSTTTTTTTTSDITLKLQ